MTNLSDLFPAGAGKQVSFTASGNVTSSGKPVILNSDGTVSEVGGGAFAIGAQSSAVASITPRDYSILNYDTSQDRVVLAYVTSTGTNFYLAAGEVSGTTITWGTPVEIQSSINAAQWAAAYDASSSSIVYAFETGTNIQVGCATLSGSTITVHDSNEATISQNVDRLYCVYDASNSKTLIYAKANATNVGICWAATVTGTTPAISSSFAFSGSDTIDVASAVHDPDQNRVIIASGLTGTSNGKCYTIDCSGATPTGATSQFQATDVYNPNITYDTANDKVVISYYDNANSGYQSYIAGTVDGSSNTITFGTKTTTSSAQNQYPSWNTMRFDTANSQSVNIWTGSNTSPDNYGSYITNATLSGTTVVLGDLETVHAPAGSANSWQYVSMVYDPDTNKMVIAYSDYGNSYYPYGNVVTPGFTNLTSTNFLGISDAAISSAASGNITIKGGIAATGLSSLTPGSDYYVQTDGTIAAGATSIAYDISSLTYTQTFSVSSQDTDPTGLAFNTDGTKMFVVGNSANAIHEYALSTGFDISTASFTQSFSVASQSTAPSGIAFKPDGTIMFVAEAYNSTILQYALSSAFDVSSASYTHNFNVASQEADVRGVAFNSDGTVMLITGIGGDDVNEYALSSAYDVSSASFVDLFSIASQETNPQDLLFNSDGTTMWIVGDDNDALIQYTLTSGFDVSTASYTSTGSSLASQDTSPMGMAFNSDGTKLYVVGQQNDAVYQYATTSTSFSTDNRIGKALSTTTINLEYQS